MHTSARKLAPNARVTACEVAATLRALSIRLDKDGKETSLPTELASRIDQIVALFLEKRWKLPRRFDQIQPLSYVLFQAPDEDPTFTDDIENIRHSLEQFLFGQEGAEDTKIASVIGETEDVTDIARVSDAEFREQAPAVATRAAAAQPAQPARPEPAPSAPPNGAAAEDDIVITEDAPAPTALSATAARTALRARLRMRAIYDAPNTAVVAYWAAVIRQSEGREPIAYNDFVTAHKSQRDALELAALEFAAPRITAQLKSGSTAHCVVPISYRTFSDRRLRQSYLQVSAQIPKEIRRFIIVGVCGGPEGPSSSVLVEAAGAMRQYYNILNWETAS
ncbi:MAG: hypothetical protein PVI23_15680, partial [Maricaulaceae bacterium]